MTSAADWRNSQQSYTTGKDERAPGTGQMYERDNQMKMRKANQLSSNVLTHDDENVRNERLNAFDNSRDAKISGTASNANWSA